MLSVPSIIGKQNALTKYNSEIFIKKIQINQTIQEVTLHCTLCNSLTKIDNCVPKLLKNDRGVFAKVVKEGKIELLDEIKI